MKQTITKKIIQLGFDLIVISLVGDIFVEDNE